MVFGTRVVEVASFQWEAGALWKMLRMQSRSVVEHHLPFSLDWLSMHGGPAPGVLARHGRGVLVWREQLRREVLALMEPWGQMEMILYQTYTTQFGLLDPM